MKHIPQHILVLTTVACCFAIGGCASKSTEAGGQEQNVRAPLALKADSLFALGQHFLELAAYDSAQVYYDRAATLYEQAGDRRHFVYTLNKLSWTSRLQHEYQQSLVYARRAEERSHAWFPVPDSLLGEALVYLGTIYSGVLGKKDSAKTYLLEALYSLKATVGEEHLNTIDAYHALGTLYQLEKDYGKALSYHRKALALRQL